VILAELLRKVESMVHVGLVEEVDHSNKRLRINYEDSDGDSQVTGWIAWPADLGRNYVRWKPIRIGTQVVLLSESGDLSNAVIVSTLYTPAQNITPPTVDPSIDQIKFNDGTFIEYDSSNKVLTANSVGTINFNAPVINAVCDEFSIDTKTLSINASTTSWSGNVGHGGGDFRSNDVSVKYHNHKENGSGNYTDDAS